MNRAVRLEELLAAFLRYGSWSASAAIGLGYALALIRSHPPTRNLAALPNMRIVSVGIVLFILLPILRVLLMLLVFIRERDFRFAFISGTVLTIILLGIFLGVSCNIGHGPTALSRTCRNLTKYWRSDDKSGLPMFSRRFRVAPGSRTTGGSRCVAPYGIRNEKRVSVRESIWLVGRCQVIVQKRFTIRSGIISKWRALSVATPQPCSKADAPNGQVIER
jgi:hypothetical protein